MLASLVPKQSRNPDKGAANGLRNGANYKAAPNHKGYHPAMKEQQISGLNYRKVLIIFSR